MFILKRQKRQKPYKLVVFKSYHFTMTSIPDLKTRVFMNSSTRNGKQRYNFTSATSILFVIKFSQIKNTQEIGVGVK